MKLTRLICIVALAGAVAACGDDSDGTGATGGTGGGGGTGGADDGGTGGGDGGGDAGAGACLAPADSTTVETMRAENTDKGSAAGIGCIQFSNPSNQPGPDWEGYEGCVSMGLADSGDATKFIDVATECRDCFSANVRCSSENCVYTGELPDGNPEFGGPCSPLPPGGPGPGTQECEDCQVAANCFSDFNSCTGIDLPRLFP